MQKFAALSGFVSTNAGGDFHPRVRREPRFLTPSRLLSTDKHALPGGVFLLKERCKSVKNEDPTVLMVES